MTLQGSNAKSTLTYGPYLPISQIGAGNKLVWSCLSFRISPLLWNKNERCMFFIYLFYFQFFQNNLWICLQVFCLETAFCLLSLTDWTPSKKESDASADFFLFKLLSLINKQSTYRSWTLAITRVTDFSTSMRIWPSSSEEEDFLTGQILIAKYVWLLKETTGERKCKICWWRKEQPRLSLVVSKHNYIWSCVCRILIESCSLWAVMTTLDTFTHLYKTSDLFSDTM